MAKVEPKIEPKLGDDIPEEWIKKAEKEIKASYRTIVLNEFRKEKDVELHIHQPTSGIESISSDSYTKAFSRLIKDKDILTRKQMERLLEDRGDWGKDQEETVETIREDMREIELRVAKMRKKGNFNSATMNKLRSQWINKREEISDLLNEKNSMLSNTVEGRAEEEEVKAKLSFCVKFPNGDHVWKSVEELNNESDRIAVVQLVNESLLFWAGLTQEIIDDLPVRLMFGGEEKSGKLQDQ
jgi:hypothetical protein